MTGYLTTHVLDLAKRQLLDADHGDVPLTSGEFDVLKTFAENPNRPLSRDWLLETTSHRARDRFIGSTRRTFASRSAQNTGGIAIASTTTAMMTSISVNPPRRRRPRCPTLVTAMSHAPSAASQSRFGCHSS
mgnify:CR=1 FL=1